MNWIEKELENNPPVYIGEYNKYLFQIKKFPKNYPHKGFFVIIDDLKTENSLNSLWIKIYFEKLEDIQRWCNLYAIYNKEIRITKETRKKWVNPIKK